MSISLLILLWMPIPSATGIATVIPISSELRSSHPVSTREASTLDGEALRTLQAAISSNHLFDSLIAIDEVAAMTSPDAINALCDVLASNPHRWLQMAALDGLRQREDQQLILCGGTRLLELLTTVKKHPSSAIRRRAGTIHDRLEKLMAGTDSIEPPPSSPPIDKIPPSKPTGTSVVSKAKMRHPSTSASRITRQLAGGIDLVWALDVSGSMEVHLATAIGEIRQLEKILTPLLGEIRWGCVAYRDKVIGVLPLTNDWNALDRILTSLVAEKGGGPEERVDRALSMALSPEMGWKKNRIGATVFVADAAPKLIHGRTLPRRLHKFCKKRVDLRVHATLFGPATQPGLSGQFWKQLTEASGGSCIDFEQPFSPKLRLLEVILTDVYPEGERQQIERIVSLIRRVEGNGN